MPRQRDIRITYTTEDVFGPGPEVDLRAGGGSNEDEAFDHLGERLCTRMRGAGPDAGTTAGRRRPGGWWTGRKPDGGSRWRGPAWWRRRPRRRSPDRPGKSGDRRLGHGSGARRLAGLGLDDQV